MLFIVVVILQKRPCRSIITVSIVAFRPHLKRMATPFSSYRRGVTPVADALPLFRVRIGDGLGDNMRLL